MGLPCIHAFDINLVNHLTGKRRLLGNFKQTSPENRFENVLFESYINECCGPVFR